MGQLSSASHDTVILHIVYTMLTRWIPVPFVDFIAANIVRRQMVSKLAESHGVKLESAAVKILADEQMGCISGCLFNILLFPIKLIVGKLFLLFRFKQFVDKASRQYHAARLVDYVLRSKLVAPAGPHSAQAVRGAIENLCETSDIGPVSHAFRQVLKKQAGVLKDAAGLFWKSLRSARSRGEEDVKDAVKEAEAETAQQVGGVLAPFRTALEAIPPEHFQKLEDALFRKLNEELMRG